MNLRLASWNLFGLEDEHLDLRTEAAVFRVLLGGSPEQLFAGELTPQEPPDILCLQEVVERSLRAHLLPHLRAAGYAIVSGVEGSRSYFELIAVRAPWKVAEHRITRLPSQQGRELVEVIAEVGDQRLLILTAHLESLKEGAPWRARQSEAILQRLASHDGPAVFTGDTNLRDSEAAALALGEVRDAWEACGEPGAARWTRRSPRTRARSRYDRVWARGVDLNDFQTFGGEPVTPEGEPASDHLGVAVSLGLAERRPAP